MKFSPGERVGNRFEIRGTLGQGGVGTVYLVMDHDRNELVAMKILNPRIATNELAVARLKREVEIMKLIKHPSIVPVFDTGSIQHSLFYTMEYVRGARISDYIKRDGQINLRQAVNVVRRLCRALEKVHEIAIHRDISSDNVMVQKGGVIRLLDFGTARIVGADSTLTRTGIHLGKIHYSAPEQYDNAKNVDHRADLYSVAALLYEMLTGKLNPRFEPVTHYRADLSEEWNTFFERALARDPNERYDSAAALKSAIESLAK